MICKNCSAEYDGSYFFCPKCGKENEGKFIVTMPEFPEYTEYPKYNGPMEYTDISSFSEGDGSVAVESPVEEIVAPVFEIADEGTDTAEAPEEEAAPVFELTDDSEAVAEDSDIKPYEYRMDDVESAQPQESEEQACPQYTVEKEEVAAEQAEQPEEAAQPVRPKVRKRPIRREVEVNRKEENKPIAVIIAVMCVIAILAGVLSTLKINTDTLETTEPTEKVVANIGLSAQEEIALEEILSRSFSVLKTDYNSELTDAEEFLKRVNLYDRGGVYSMVYNENPAIQTEADPALRFYNEEEKAYSYYKTEEKKIDDLMLMFGVEAHHAVNTENCYYYDGFYYFAPVVQKMTIPVKAEITKSKRVLDGSYYCELYFYAESGEKRVETDTYYLVAEKTNDTQSGELFFKIKKISTAPIFDTNGKLVEEKNYKIKKQVIEGRTDDGKLYCRYTFEYPVFTGDGIGYQSINDFFSTAITAYRLKADSAQKSYESFIAQGGKDSDLPFTETVIARVSYENENYISVVERIGVDEPVVEQKVEATTQSDDEEYYEDEEQSEEPEIEAVTLFKRLVDGYVFDKATGEFVSKDVLAGKDYLAVSEILYRIYNSYEYESIIPEPKAEEVTDEYGEVIEEDEEYYEEEDYYYYDDDEIPDDDDGFGTVLYESACAFTQNGFTFYYVNEHGFVEEVTIPHAVVEKLALS